jgi:twitching motility protein PilT
MQDKTQVLNDLIALTLREGGSDIHLTEGRSPAMRVGGELIFLVKENPLSHDDMMGFLEALMGKEKSAHFMDVKELDFAYTFGHEARLRGNAFMRMGMVGVALRIIPKVRPIEELNLPDILKTFASKKQGFFLVVGPVGQGKSTTVSALIDYINTERAEHIITVEDPAEYIYEQKRSIIDQREVGIDTESFDTALKSIFREDANVLLIGEMRSPETIRTAVTAAETGHLVFSTVHTNTASQTIDRIIDVFPGDQQDQIRSQLSSTLLGIFSQRLVPRISGGLVPAYELLVNTRAVANMIREKRTHEIDSMIETGTGEGMIDLNRSLLNLVRSGEITMDNAYLFSAKPDALARMI